MKRPEEDYKVGGGFAFMEAPFASHPNDERRARETIVMMVQDELSRDEMISLFRKYIDAHFGPDNRERQLAKVKEKIAAWAK
jgi:hypothetical protein